MENHIKNQINKHLKTIEDAVKEIENVLLNRYNISSIEDALGDITDRLDVISNEISNLSTEHQQLPIIKKSENSYYDENRTPTNDEILKKFNK